MATIDSLRSPLNRRDQLRHALQAPISAPKYCVMYDVGREHHCTPWFYCPVNARKALEIMRRKHGQDKAIIYVD